jgi:aminoacrylate hydrolase
MPIMSVLTVPDGSLYYEMGGAGIPVLFIQGVGVTGEGWRLQVEALSHRFRTLTFDNRGLGRSVPWTGPVTIECMAADARALMDAAGWDSAHVVGHSMGGVIAQQLALDVPQRIRSLSLLCTFARGKDAARLTPWALWMTLRTRVGTRRMRRNAFLQLLFTPEELQGVDRDVLAQKVALLIGRDLAYSPPVLLRQVRALSRHNASARLGELKNIPTLVMSAGQDLIALPRHGRELAQSIPGARFELVPGASHGIILNRPQLVNDALESFIAEAERARTSLPGDRRREAG